MDRSESAHRVPERKPKADCHRRCVRCDGIGWVCGTCGEPEHCCHCGAEYNPVECEDCKGTGK